MKQLAGLLWRVSRVLFGDPLSAASCMAAVGGDGAAA